MKRNTKVATGLAVLSIAMIAGLFVVVLVLSGGTGKGQDAGAALLPGAANHTGATAVAAGNGASGPAGRASSTSGSTSSETDSSSRSSAPDGHAGETPGTTASTAPTAYNADSVSPLDVDPGRVWASTPAPRRLLDMTGSFGPEGGTDTSEAFMRGTRDLTMTVTSRETAPVFDMEVQRYGEGVGLVQVNSRWDAPTGTKTVSFRIVIGSAYRLWVAGTSVDYHITIDEI